MPCVPSAGGEIVLWLVSFVGCAWISWRVGDAFASVCSSMSSWASSDAYSIQAEFEEISHDEATPFEQEWLLIIDDR